MNKEALNGLKLEEQLQEEFKDTSRHIEDLEAELDHFYVNESERVMDIISIEQTLDSLYKKINKLENEINQISES